jgi:hypothetical protein
MLGKKRKKKKRKDKIIDREVKVIQYVVPLGFPNFKEEQGNLLHMFFLRVFPIFRLQEENKI